MTTQTYSAYSAPRRRILRQQVKPPTVYGFQTTSSHSTANCAKEATMRRKSFCVIAVTEDATYSAFPHLWNRFQRVSGSAHCARQRTRMVSLKDNSTAWMSSRRRLPHSRRTSLGVKPLPRRYALAVHRMLPLHVAVQCSSSDPTRTAWHGVLAVHLS